MSTLYKNHQFNYSILFDSIIISLQKKSYKTNYNWLSFERPYSFASHNFSRFAFFLIKYFVSKIIILHSYVTCSITNV